MGSVISQHHLERIEKIVQRKEKGSGKILFGGNRMTGLSALDQFDFSKGTFFEPTVIADVSTEDDLWREEVFGPVVVVKRFSVSSITSVTSEHVTDCVDRKKRMALHWPMQVNTVLALLFGRKICLERIASRPRLKLASSG